MASGLVWRSRLRTDCKRGCQCRAQNLSGGGGLFGVRRLRGGVVALVLLGSVVVVSLIDSVAFAQTVPDAPTAVAVYSIESEKLEVRWSSSDSSVTAFKVQWKSGSEMFDSSRQVSISTTASIVNVQSTSAGDRYKATLTGLSDGTEHTVRVIAVNSSGDSDPSSEVTGTPQSTPGQVREFWEQEVVEIFESSRPWLRETWDHITAENASVLFTPTSGVAFVECSINRPTAPRLRECYATWVGIERGYYNLIYGIIHELAHVYTLANSVTATSAPLGVAHLYFHDLVSPPGRGGQRCDPVELYADAVTLVDDEDFASSATTTYWTQCSLVPAAPSEQAFGVVRSATTGQMPSWFADTYNDSNGDPDLERVWADVKAIRDFRWRATVVFQLRDAFGGYCDDHQATASAFSDGVTRNPWRDGGCVPEAPTNAAATAAGSGKLTVSWQEPYDGGWPIQGYKVQWKSGTQDYSSSRQAVVTHLSDPVLVNTISGLTNDESHTLRVLAYNQNGDGAAAEMTATPTATDATAPTLLLARLHEQHSWVRLIWNETLRVSSVPTSTAFTVNVNGVSRAIDRINVPDGNVLNLRLSGAIGVSDSVTVTYTVPTGAGARPLKDLAGNNAEGLSSEMVRNDKTQVAITSDPGTDMTYAWRNGYGGQDVIEATVTFSENVVVRGAPHLELEVGGKTRRARYHSGSGTTSLVFRYPVTQLETDTDGVAVPRESIQTAGLVRYASTNAVAPPQEGLGTQAGHLVDAVRPTLVSATALANGNDVTLTWDKDLDEDAMLHPGVGFVVQDASTSTRRTNVTISVEGRTVTLTVTPIISATDQLSVSWGWPYEVYDGVTVDPVADTVGNYAKRTARPLAVSIKQPNNPPEFPSSEDGARNVDENTAAGRHIGTPIRATDADNDRLTYSISGADAASFDVVESSGQLRTKGALDHEGNSSYSFTMSVTDGTDIHGNSDTTIDDTISVTVTVDDVDEPADISLAAASGVTSSGNALAVDENHDGALATFTASDPENKAGLTFTWSLGGTDRSDFALTDAVVLSFVNVPDHDRPADSGGNNVYDITVSARDSDNKTATIAVTVTVDPVDEPPVITGDAAVRVEEGGTVLVGTYRASDPENATVAWQPLAGDDNDKFEFTASSGRLAFKAAPDYENAADSGGDNVYDVTLGVSAGGHTTTFDVAVTVTNKDEAGAVGFSSPRPQAGADYTATLSDPDAAVSTTWTWERSTSRSGPWTAVSGATGGATTSVYGPVAGDVGHYLRVTADYTDGHGPNKSRVLVSANAVRAAPIDNVAPSFSDRAPTRTIAENARARAAVGAPVRATDTDSGDVVTYELSGSDLFSIDSASGQIRVVARDSLDHETAPSHSVSVKASDTSNASDTVTVTIEVTDVNEPPDAVADTASASEDGDVTIDVLANDSDPEDDRSALTVTVTRNPRRGRATVNEPANVGENPTITYTPNANYHGADIFTYRVWDSGSPALSSTTTVTVEVDAVNDAPTFRSPTTARSVSKSADFGDRVGAPVTATDADDNDTLTYRLSGSEARFFDVGARSGQITVGEEVTFDIATKDTYTVTVDADDGNGGTASTEVTITVTSSGPGPGPGPGLGGGGGGGGGPAPAVSVEGAAFGAVGADAEFTVAVVGVEGLGSVSWVAAGPDGFTTAGDAERFTFAPPAGGAYTVTVTVITPSRETLTDSVTLSVFGDITDHQFIDEIVWLAKSGITVGCSREPLEYCPSSPVTRAQMASFLARALDLGAPQQPAGFDDVDPSSGHAANIEALFAAQITKGCSSEPLRYCPDSPVTRAQMASFLARALDLGAPQQPAGFDDVDPSSGHAANIEALYAAQITKGCSSEPLWYCPDRPVTRAQMAAFLYRARHLIAAASNSN